MLDAATAPPDPSNLDTLLAALHELDPTEQRRNELATHIRQSLHAADAHPLITLAVLADLVAQGIANGSQSHLPAMTDAILQFIALRILQWRRPDA